MKVVILILLLVYTLDSTDSIDQECATSTDERYARIDGRCNNLNNPSFGAAGEPFGRLVEPLPDDCQDNIRPGAKAVCDALFTLDSEDKDDGSYSALVTYFGQFIDHDLTLTNHPSSDCTDGDSSADVCNVDKCNKDNQCRITDNQLNQPPSTCIKFTQSTKTNGEQHNDITSYLDLSNVYGSTVEQNNLLRSDSSDGKLMVLLDDDCGILLPRQNGQFIAGDVRANENPILAALHTLFVMEHNRIAEGLKREYEKKGYCTTLSNDEMDELLFQRARKINIAQMQWIVKNEYLGELGIKISDDEYDETCNASIFQEFSTAAYRFGHSAVKNKFTFGKSRKERESIPLRDLFFDTRKFLEHCTAGVLAPQWSIPSEKIDTVFTKSIGKDLFIPSFMGNKSQSLCALNIQRGRDHKLGTYQNLFDQCLTVIPNIDETTMNNINIENFDDFPLELMSESDKNILKGLYNNDLSKVDLFAIGLAEKPLAGHRMGPLFHCVLTKQFQNLFKCDRFYYRNCGNDNVCQTRKIEIEKRRLSDIICDNLKDLDEVPKNVFAKPKKYATHLNCNFVRKIKFKLWVDEECE